MFIYINISYVCRERHRAFATAPVGCNTAGTCAVLLGLQRRQWGSLRYSTRRLRSCWALHQAEAQNDRFESNPAAACAAVAIAVDCRNTLAAQWSDGYPSTRLRLPSPVPLYFSSPVRHTHFWRPHLVGEGRRPRPPSAPSRHRHLVEGGRRRRPPSPSGPARPVCVRPLPVHSAMPCAAPLRRARPGTPRAACFVCV